MDQSGLDPNLFAMYTITGADPGFREKCTLCNMCQVMKIHVQSTLTVQKSFNMQYSIFLQIFIKMLLFPDIGSFPQIDTIFYMAGEIT